MKNLPARSGFSLVEMGIVLGVVGLVIGGIWLAGSAYLSAHKVNETASGITDMLSNVYGFFPPEIYPKVQTASIDVTSTSHKAGLVPPSFSYDGGVLRSPLGNSIRVFLACWKGGGCPKSGDAMIAIQWAGPASTWKPGTLSSKDCNNLIAKLAGMLNKDEDFIYFQIMTASNSGYQFLYRPVNINTIDCPSNYSGVTLWYRPPSS